MKNSVLCAVLVLIGLTALAVLPAHADGIDFTSASGGGLISWNGLSTGDMVGSTIPITHVAFTGMPEHPVTGFKCGSGKSKFACGLLSFSTGTFVSETSTSFTFNGSGSLKIKGELPGGNKVVTLMTATFLRYPVTITKLGKSTWELAAPIRITAVDRSLTAMFPLVLTPAQGDVSLLIIKFHLTRSGGFVGTATSQDLFVSAVPEPSSMMLFGSGVMAMGSMLRRRKKGA